MGETSSNLFTFVSYPRVDKKIIRDLVNAAQTAYAQLPSDMHCLLARMLFLRLIDLDSIEQDKVILQPRRVFMSELALSDVEQSNIMREVVNIFVDAATLIVGEINEKWFVIVSNEILLQEWDLLHDWLQDEGLDALRLQHRIHAAATDWQRRGCSKESLYRGKLLEEALTVVQKTILNEVEEEFIKESMKEQGTQFSWEVAKLAAIGAGIFGTAFAVVRKMQVDTELRNAKYWRNRNYRELMKLKKSQQKHK